MKIISAVLAILGVVLTLFFFLPIGLGVFQFIIEVFMAIFA